MKSGDGEVPLPSRRPVPPTAVISAVHSLFQMPAGPGPRLWIATRAALSIAGPFAVLTALGLPSIGLQAAAGAFVALFSANLAAAERAKVLPLVGLGLLASAALGVLCTVSTLWLAIGLVFVAIAAATLCLAYRVGPPGPVFFVLSYGLAANITGFGSGMGMLYSTGERLNDPLVFLAAIAGGAVFSYLLALAPLLRAAERAKPVRALRELLPGPWLGKDEGLLILRIAIAAVVGTAVTVLWLDPHRAYWTVSASVAVVGLAAVRRHSLGRGLHRTSGTLVGAALYLAIAPVGALTIGGAPWPLVILLALLQFGIELVVVRNYAFALVFVTPLVLLISGAATGGTHLVTAAGERVIDTVLGSAIAMLTALVHGSSKRRAVG